MLRKLFSKKKPANNDTFITARLNMKLQPMDRGEDYEGPLTEMLEAQNIGEVTGGGALLGDKNLRTEEGNHEGIDYCEIEISAIDSAPNTTEQIIKCLENLGAPKGSRLIFSDDLPDIKFGTLEGLGLYLNGTDLPDEVYANDDVNDTIEKCIELMGSSYRKFTHWDGSKDTAVYFYGTTYTDMKSAIAGYVNSNPACALSRFHQIA